MRVSKTAVQLYDGAYYDIGRPEAISVENLAHALALMNRFGGNTRVPYSVAQHSFYVMLKSDPEDRKYAALHDGSEGLGMGDICAPLKKLMPQYYELEDQVMKDVHDRFGLEHWPMPYSVHKADMRMCVTESRDLIDPHSWKDWNINEEPYGFEVRPWPWQTAKHVFIQMCNELGIK